MGILGSNLHVEHIVMTSDFMIPWLQVSSPNVQEWQGDRIASVLIPPKSMYCDTKLVNTQPSKNSCFPSRVVGPVRLSH